MEAQNTAKNKPLRMHLLELTSMLVKLKRSRLPISNAAYNNVLDTQLMASIKRCEKEETALLSMDYPLSESSMVHGVMGLKAYMLNLCYENYFCAEYEKDEIAWLYDTYCKSLEGDQSPQCNIYNAIYINALFCDYLKKDYGTLRLSESDCKIAQNLLSALNDDDRYEILFGCAKHFTYGSIAYNNKAFDRVFPAIISAVKHKTLHKLLILD